jgi:hypothetical protein
MSMHATCAAVLYAQDMLFAMRILNSVGLKVKLPMKLEIDNRGTVDFTHNYSVGGRTGHVEVKKYFLRELKEAGLIICEWCKGDDMSSDIFTKNCSGVLFDKHIQKFVSYDKYMEDHGVVVETGADKGRVLESGCEYQDTTQWESNERHTDRERDEILDHKLHHNSCNDDDQTSMMDTTKKFRRGQFE